MSDFKLSEIAGWIGKDEKTLRRWCIAGRVEGAFQTQGGHWRVAIEAQSPALAASNLFRSLDKQIKSGRTRKFTPRHRNKSQKKLNDTFNDLRRFHARGRGRVFLQAVGVIISRVDQMEFSHDERFKFKAFLESLVSQREISAGLFDEVQRVAAGVWAWDAHNKGRRGYMGAALEAGMPRTTFRLHFLKFLPSRVDAEESPRDDDRIDFDGMDARLGWFEPID